jgi:hypothetical protein
VTVNRPIAGGFVGTEKLVSAADKAKALETLKSELKAKLLAKAAGQIPADYILFPDMTEVTYEELPITSEGSTTTAQVSVRASLKAIIFNRQSLAEYLATAQRSSVEAPLWVEEFGSSTASLADKYSIVTGADQGVRFRFVGSPRFIAEFDQDSLLARLSTVSVRQFSTIFAEYPAVGRAQVVFRPSLARFIPVRPAKMVVEILPEK